MASVFYASGNYITSLCRVWDTGLGHGFGSQSWPIVDWGLLLEASATISFCYYRLLLLYTSGPVLVFTSLSDTEKSPARLDCLHPLPVGSHIRTVDPANGPKGHWSEVRVMSRLMRHLHTNRRTALFTIGWPAHKL